MGKARVVVHLGVEGAPACALPARSGTRMSTTTNPELATCRICLRRASVIEPRDLLRWLSAGI